MTDLRERIERAFRGHRRTVERKLDYAAVVEPLLDDLSAVRYQAFSADTVAEIAKSVKRSRILKNASVIVADICRHPDYNLTMMELEPLSDLLYASVTHPTIALTTDSEQPNLLAVRILAK